MFLQCTTYFCFNHSCTVCAIHLSIYSIADSEGVKYIASLWRLYMHCASWYTGPQQLNGSTNLKNYSQNCLYLQVLTEIRLSNFPTSSCWNKYWSWYQILCTVLESFIHGRSYVLYLCPYHKEYKYCTLERRVWVYNTYIPHDKGEDNVYRAGNGTQYVMSLTGRGTMPFALHCA